MRGSLTRTVARAAVWAVPVVLACTGSGDASDAAASGSGAGGDHGGSAATRESGPAGISGVHGRAPAASGGLPSVVMLTPASVGAEAGGGRSEDPSAGDAVPRGAAASAHPAAPARGGDVTIDQFGLAFSPRVLVSASGEPLTFTNSEGAITHNIHIRSISGDSTVFNGDTGPSEGVDVELPGPGGYDVLCDMHPGMTAFVFVTEAPWAVAADTDGTFALGRVPPGAYMVRVWTAEGGMGEERPVTVGEDPTELDLTRPP